MGDKSNIEIQKECAHCGTERLKPRKPWCSPWCLLQIIRQKGPEPILPYLGLIAGSPKTTRFLVEDARKGNRIAEWELIDGKYFEASIRGIIWATDIIPGYGPPLGYSYIEKLSNCINIYYLEDRFSPDLKLREIL